MAFGGLLIWAASALCNDVAAAEAQSSPFTDARCAFSADYPGGMPAPAIKNTTEATTADITGPGYRISYACIASANAPIPLLEGHALYDRLTSIAGSLGVSGAKVTTPVSPAASCGLIEAPAAAGRSGKTRTQFCYGPLGYLIVETASDGSPAAEQAVSAVLASIAARPANS